MICCQRSGFKPRVGSKSNYQIKRAFARSFLREASTLEIFRGKAPSSTRHRSANIFLPPHLYSRQGKQKVFHPPCTELRFDGSRTGAWPDDSSLHSTAGDGSYTGWGPEARCARTGSGHSNTPARLHADAWGIWQAFSQRIVRV